MSLWYLSLASEAGFVGVTVVEARTAEAAALRAKALGHYRSGSGMQILAVELEPPHVDLYRPKLDRLLTLAELREIDPSITHLGEHCDELGIEPDDLPGITHSTFGTAS